MRRRFDLTPLGHPIWWGALALLLLNDNLLKGRGVVPGWLTGKLSDFAFLVVAPVVFAALIPRRMPGRRTFATTAVVGLYVAADLSRPVSDAVVALAARLGLSWRLWPDPTDLLALAVLPATIWLLRRQPGPAGAGARRGRVRRERAGVVLGAIACIATSAPPTYVQHPFMHNRTGGDVDVRITWVLSKVDCSSTPESLAATLGPSDLDDPRTMKLGSGDVAALDGPPPAGTSPVGLCASNLQSYNNTECVAAIVETDGAAPVLMVTPKQWALSGDSAFVCPGPPPVSECAPHLDPGKRLGRDTLGISDSDGRRRFEVSHSGRTEQGLPDGTVQIAPIDPAAIQARPPAAGACRDTRDAYRAALQSSTACATDADCTTLPAPSIAGEAASCAIYVNKSASAATFAALDMRWNAACLSASELCVTASRPICKAGACADPCVGLALPMCPVSCGVDYASMTSKTPCQAAFSCLQNDGLLCTCEGGYLACKSPPLVDARCPIGCLPATPTQYRSTQPGYVPDAGVVDAGGEPPLQDAGRGPDAREVGETADAQDGAGQ